MSNMSNNTPLGDGQHSIITFATNQLSYTKFALNCAESILLHNDIRVFIVSNIDFLIPERLKNRIFTIPARAEHLSLGIGIKLHIDSYIQTTHTLFIDSDCLCFSNLTEIFKACENNDVSVVGNIILSQDWCNEEQAKTIKKHFGIDKIIRFNGGLYYIKKSALTIKIFKEARKIAENYDEYGFYRIKDRWINEEVPLSIAMTIFKQLPIADDGTYMTDLHTDHRPKKINVLNGRRLLKNPAHPHRQHRPWYPQSYSPIILHFGGNSLHSYPYLSQTILLYLYRMGSPVWLSSTLVNILVHPVFRFYYFIKRIKQIFGVKSR